MLFSTSRRHKNIAVFVLLLALRLVSCVDNAFANVSFSAIASLELNLGAQYGLSPETMDEEGVAQSTVGRVMSGASKKSPDSLYFLGLLRLYGQGGLPEDHAKGATNILEAAELGHVEAQGAIGMLLLHGVGVKEDEAAAQAWIRRAAKSENKDAQWMLGKLLLEKEAARAAALSDHRRQQESASRISADGGASEPGASFANGARFGEALALLTRAAKQDSKEAYYHLGMAHEYGTGVAVDQAAAHAYYRKAARQGYAPATYNLALQVAYGRGCTQDFREAYHLLQEGASRGHAPSMYYCGVFNLYGHGVPVDYNSALFWFEQAAQLEDLAVSGKARAAAEELRVSLEKAKAVNDGLVERYAAGARAGDAGPGSGHGSDHDSALRFVDVDAAEDQVLEEMEKWRHEHGRRG
mmetsp:Transcript_12408/g.24518  ORF Transcript_12408/g.24518 Transcript_12408/m.24518 type:complete len:411 (+) Transcript_12408:163-1395(+)